MNWMNLWQLETRGVTILLLAWVVTAALRKSAAAKRHAVWAVAILTVGFLPLLMMGAPRWAAGAAVPALKPAIRELDLATDDPSFPDSKTTGPELGSSDPLLGLPPETTRIQGARDFAAALDNSLLERAWALISGMLLLRLFLACMRVRKIVLNAARFGVQAGYRMLLADIRVPAVVGFIRPVVLLPLTAADWPEEQKQAVVCHELGHIERKDWLWQLLGQIACTLYPFNPMLWFAASRMRAESELACDDLVLLQGFDSTAYAQILLGVARNMRPACPSAAVVGMTRTAHVEGRIRAILDSYKKRARVTRRIMFVVGLGAIVCGAVVAGEKVLQGPIHAPVALSSKWFCAAPVGRVVDEDGHPLSSAKIYATGFRGHYWESVDCGTTQPDGSFDLRSLHLGPDEHFLWLTAFSHGHGLGGFDLEMDEAPVIIVCGRPATARVTVTTPSGLPAIGELVYVDSVTFPPQYLPALTRSDGGRTLNPTFFAVTSSKRELSAVTDSKGQTEITCLPFGSSVGFSVADDRYWPKAPPAVEIAKARVNAGTIHLVGAGIISGRVLADGRPVVGAKVIPSSGISVARWDLGIYFARFGITDLRGRYSLKGLPPGKLALHVDSDSIPSNMVVRDLTDVRVNRNDIDIHLEHGGLLKGRVCADRETLDAGESITIYSKTSGTYLQNAVARSDGTFETRLPSGNYVVSVMADAASHYEWDQEVFVPEGGVATANF